MVERCPTACDTSFIEGRDVPRYLNQDIRRNRYGGVRGNSQVHSWRRILPATEASRRTLPATRATEEAYRSTRWQKRRRIATTKSRCRAQHRHTSNGPAPGRHGHDTDQARASGERGGLAVMHAKKIVPPVIRHALRRILQGALGPYARLSFSQDAEDLLLEVLLGGQGEGFYVDVGAHHPVRFSNTYLLYLQGWRGIAIDANPTFGPLFRRRRPRDTFVCSGISDERTNLPFFEFKEPALSTFDPEIAAQRDASVWGVPTKRLVPVATLADVLEASMEDDQEIDLLTIDCEGFDMRVLRSNAWARFRPRCVVVERSPRVLQDASYDEVDRYLSQYGYATVARTLRSSIYVLDVPTS